MKTGTDPRQLVRTMVVANHRPLEDSIRVIREKRAGKDAAFAVAFEDRDGVERRGVLRLRRQHGTWQPAGLFMGSVRVPGPNDVWITWGGSGPGGGNGRELCGGWVADPSAVRARLIDPASGTALVDDIENGVALFFWKGDFNSRYARVELLDAEARIVRSGPLYRNAESGIDQRPSLSDTFREQPDE